MKSRRSVGVDGLRVLSGEMEGCSPNLWKAKRSYQQRTAQTNRIWTSGCPLLVLMIVP